MKFVLDPELCTGCRACELACSFAKEGVFSPTKSRIRVVKIDHEGVDVPVGCEHCDDAPCIVVCPVKALFRDERDAVQLDNDRCIGCKQCVLACPFGAVHYDEESRQFLKCDLCEGDPECAKWCFTGAIALKDMGHVSRKKHRSKAEEFIKIYESMRSRMPPKEGDTK